MAVLTWPVWLLRPVVTHQLQGIQRKPAIHIDNKLSKVRPRKQLTRISTFRKFGATSG
jgi:hypothetical protein